MAAAQNTPAVLPQMPDFSAHNNPFSTAGDMKFHLQILLDSKENQLQQAGTLGQRVLAQQMELEERIRQLQEIEADKGDDDELNPEARDRYRDLADTILAWDAENAQLSGAFGGSSKRFPQPPSPSPAFADLPREESERSKASGSTSAAQSRRAKNAAHRADDVEFAFEIGSGLLTEVRRLQSLLGERDKAIQDMKEEKDDLEKSLEALRTALRQQEQSADKFKEENWNLEVTLQEIRAQLGDYQASTQRLESEHKRLTKALATTRDTNDQHKNEAERLQNLLEEIKAKHETDVAQARKHAAGLMRDKSDLQQAIDTLKTEANRAGRRLPRFGSPLTPNGSDTKDFLTPAGIERDGDGDVFSNTGGLSTNRRKLDTAGMFPQDEFAMEGYADSPEASPLRKPILAPNHPTNEIEVLQQRLAHAHRQISTLKGSLNREKQARRRLEGRHPDAEDEPEEEQEDVYEDEETAVIESKKPKRTITPFKVGGRGGRGRGRGGRNGITLIQRLGMAAGSPASEYNDDEEPFNDGSPAPPVPSVPIRFSQHEQDDERERTFFSGDADMGDQEGDLRQRSPSPPPQDSPSNRTSIASVDGMDPAFANVLRRVPSDGSSYSGSPLRKILGRSARGGSVGRRMRGGGMAYKETRPPSLVDAPEVLAAELGVDLNGSPMKTLSNVGSPMKGEDIAEESELVHNNIQTAEFGCQTEALEKPEAVPDPPAVVASAPEPKITIDMAMQTDEPAITEKFHAGIQHVPEPLPVMIQAEVQTSSESPSSPALPVAVVDNAITHDLSFGSSSGDTTITRNFLAAGADEDDGDETETGAETETETEDDYQDARQSVMLSTASESREDFHSVMTMTDNEYSGSDDDGESIKASRLSSLRNVSRSEPSSGSTPSRPVLYETVGVSADLYEPPEPLLRIVEVEVEVASPKPEVKEISIQTDEWQPPPPPPSSQPAPVFIPPASKAAPSPPPSALYRVGAATHQFQFIPPPPRANTPTRSVATAIPAPIFAASSSSDVFGESNQRTTPLERKESADSLLSATTADNAANRSRVPSSSAGSILSTVDKTKPPMMVLPPPPKAPPPSNNMPPPTFIPERRKTINSHEDRPPRPSSPPPQELIQRATTPTFGSILSVPGRQHGSSMPPSQAGLRQLPSTSSFRSAANAAAYAQRGLPSPGPLSSSSVRERERREFSTTSLTSEMASPRSSISSDHHLYDRSEAVSAPVTPNKTADITPRAGPAGMQSTDPVIIHAITQTMIGEFLYKYTRRTIGKGHGQTRHKRFFWVHPYTKTLYWSSADPGSSNVSESSAKSAYIEGVRSVLDPNPMPPGLYQYSVVVSTPQREMKITAPTKERHDIWLNALKYLLSRPSNVSVTSPANLPDGVTTADEERRSRFIASPQSQQGLSGDGWNTTPRGQRSRSQVSVRGSTGKRSGTPALEYLRWNGPESPYSPEKSFVDVPSQDDEELDFELHDNSLSDDGFEGLENVRACCDGRHTVGHSGKHHHHHHHDVNNLANGRQSSDSQHLRPNVQDVVRPASPAWSLRSRTGSARSNTESGGGGGIFSWGRRDDGKLRFGSRRSTKTSVPVLE